MVAPVSVARVVVVPEDLPNLLAFPPSLLLTKRVIVEDWAETLPRARVAKIARVKVKVMFMIASVKGRRCEEFVRRDLEARLTELLSTYNFVTVLFNFISQYLPLVFTDYSASITQILHQQITALSIVSATICRVCRFNYHSNRKRRTDIDLRLSRCC